VRAEAEAEAETAEAKGDMARGVLAVAAAESIVDWLGRHPPLISGPHEDL